MSIEKAKEVATFIARGSNLRDVVLPAQIDVDQAFVSWYSKTLWNYKALIGFTSLPGQYFEVTYDGEAKAHYVDWYIKKANVQLDDQ